MQEVIRDWMQFLAEGKGAFGVVIMVLGACYLFAGWRFRRAAYLSTYAMVGIAAGVCLGRSGVEDFTYAGVIGAVAVVICVVSGKYAGALLAGGLGSVFAWWWLGPMHVPEATMGMALVLAFGAFGAVGVVNDRIVSIVLTSVVGAILMVSGLSGVAHESRSMAVQLRTMASYQLFYPFLLTVATVSGVMLQMTAAKKHQTGSVG